VAIYRAETASTGIDGRAVASARTNHFVVDDPGGEAPNAAELFLAGITGCAVLMVERLAREADLPLTATMAAMEAEREPETARDGVPVFESTRLTFSFEGLTREQAGELVSTFKAR
jgi:uncharacterized OsmC-like protein